MQHIEPEVANCTDQPHGPNTVVRAVVQIAGRTFEGVLDTGATDTAVSHQVIRRLNLLHRLQCSKTSFLTAGGGVERPVGIMLDLPI